MSAPRPDLAAIRARWPRLLHFIDISTWQDPEGIDYRAASAAVGAVVIKASGALAANGALHLDGDAAQHSAGFASIPQGFYHYSRQGLSGRALAGGREQAQYFLAAVARALAPGVRPRLLALDLEDIKDGIEAIGRAGVVRWVADFLSVLAANPWGALPVVYTSAHELSPLPELRAILERDRRIELWIAGYPPRLPDWPPAGPTQPLEWDAPAPWGAWQYSSSGLVPGFGVAKIDLNVARPGSRLERALGGGSSPPLPALLPIFALLAAALLWRRPLLRGWRRALRALPAPIRRALP